MPVFNVAESTGKEAHLLNECEDNEQSEEVSLTTFQ